MVAILLSALVADYFFLPPLHALSLAAGDALMVLTFIAVSSIIVAVVHFMNEATDRLWVQEQNAQAIFENSPAGMIAVDEDGIITLANSSAERVFGYKRQELLGTNIDTLVPIRMRTDHEKYRRAFMANPSLRPMGLGRQIVGLQKSGAEVPVEVALNSVVREHRRGALATVVDLTERKLAERRQQILSHEIQHRAKNVLSIIQAIARRTIRDSGDRESFLDKIDALSRTQDLVLTTGEVTLGQIIDSELAAFAAQVVVEGERFLLAHDAIQNFTLIVHELTINSLKHGALSGGSGVVSVFWTKTDRELLFDWNERGGPAVREPSRKGFGHVILNDMPQAFGANVSNLYGSSGFRYTLKVPLSHAAQVSEPIEPPSRAAIQ